MPKPIAPVDLEFLITDSKIPLTLVPADRVKLNPMEADVFKGFEKHLVGFNQIPSKDNGRLFTHCLFSQIGFDSKDGLGYIPVFVFEEEGTIFDSEIFMAKSYEGHKWVVLYHGLGNHSYGRRFRSEFDAMKFVKNGFKNGFQNVTGKLEFYNS
jgi:hypothetical protein